MYNFLDESGFIKYNEQIINQIKNRIKYKGKIYLDVQYDASGTLITRTNWNDLKLFYATKQNLGCFVGHLYQLEMSDPTITNYTVNGVKYKPNEWIMVTNQIAPTSPFDVTVTKFSGSGGANFVEKSTLLKTTTTTPPEFIDGEEDTLYYLNQDESFEDVAGHKVYFSKGIYIYRPTQTIKFQYIAGANAMIQVSSTSDISDSGATRLYLIKEEPSMVQRYTLTDATTVANYTIDSKGITKNDTGEAYTWEQFNAGTTPFSTLLVADANGPIYWGPRGTYGATRYFYKPEARFDIYANFGYEDDGTGTWIWSWERIWSNEDEYTKDINYVIISSLSGITFDTNTFYSLNKTSTWNSKEYLPGLYVYNGIDLIRVGSGDVFTETKNFPPTGTLDPQTLYVNTKFAITETKLTKNNWMTGMYMDESGITDGSTLILWDEFKDTRYEDSTWLTTYFKVAGSGDPAALYMYRYVNDGGQTVIFKLSVTQLGAQLAERIIAYPEKDTTKDKEFVLVDNLQTLKNKTISAENNTIKCVKTWDYPNLPMGNKEGIIYHWVYEDTATTTLVDKGYWTYSNESSEWYQLSTQVIDDLISAGETEKALSANQGYVLETTKVDRLNLDGLIVDCNYIKSLATKSERLYLGQSKMTPLSGETYPVLNSLMEISCFWEGTVGGSLFYLIVSEIGQNNEAYSRHYNPTTALWSDWECTKYSKEFVRSGANARKGLVPSPGANNAGELRFLSEKGTWEFLFDRTSYSETVSVMYNNILADKIYVNYTDVMLNDGPASVPIDHSQLEVYRYNANNGRVMLHCPSGLYFKELVSGTWGDWKKVLTAPEPTNTGYKFLSDKLEWVGSIINDTSPASGFPDTFDSIYTRFAKIVDSSATELPDGVIVRQNWIYFQDEYAPMAQPTGVKYRFQVTAEGYTDGTQKGAILRATSEYAPNTMFITTISSSGNTPKPWDVVNVVGYIDKGETTLYDYEADTGANVHGLIELCNEVPTGSAKTFLVKFRLLNPNERHYFAYVNIDKNSHWVYDPTISALARVEFMVLNENTPNAYISPVQYATINVDGTASKWAHHNLGIYSGNEFFGLVPGATTAVRDRALFINGQWTEAPMAGPSLTLPKREELCEKMFATDYLSNRMLYRSIIFKTDEDPMPGSGTVGKNYEVYVSKMIGDYSGEYKFSIYAQSIETGIFKCSGTKSSLNVYTFGDWEKIPDVSDLNKKMDKDDPVGTGLFNFGDSNTFGTQNDGFIYGKLNSVKGDFGAAIGLSNNVTENADFGSVAIGTNNKLDAVSTIAMGQNNEINNAYSQAIGLGLKINGANQMALGKYNDATETTDILQVGNGTSDTDRGNALVVDKDGLLSATNMPKVATPSKHRALTEKGTEYWRNVVLNVTDEIDSSGATGITRDNFIATYALESDENTSTVFSRVKFVTAESPISGTPKFYNVKLDVGDDCTTDTFMTATDYDTGRTFTCYCTEAAGAATPAKFSRWVETTGGLIDLGIISKSPVNNNAFDYENIFTVLQSFGYDITNTNICFHGFGIAYIRNFPDYTASDYSLITCSLEVDFTNQFVDRRRVKLTVLKPNNAISLTKLHQNSIVLKKNDSSLAALIDKPASGLPSNADGTVHYYDGIETGFIPKDTLGTTEVAIKNNGVNSRFLNGAGEWQYTMVEQNTEYVISGGVYPSISGFIQKYLSNKIPYLHAKSQRFVDTPSYPLPEDQYESGSIYVPYEVILYAGGAFESTLNNFKLILRSINTDTVYTLSLTIPYSGGAYTIPPFNQADWAVNKKVRTKKYTATTGTTRALIAEESVIAERVIYTNVNFDASIANENPTGDSTDRFTVEIDNAIGSTLELIRLKAISLKTGYSYNCLATRGGTVTILTTWQKELPDPFDGDNSGIVEAMTLVENDGRNTYALTGNGDWAQFCTELEIDSTALPMTIEDLIVIYALPQKTKLWHTALSFSQEMGSIALPEGISTSGSPIVYDIKANYDGIFEDDVDTHPLSLILKSYTSGQEYRATTSVSYSNPMYSLSTVLKTDWVKTPTPGLDTKMDKVDPVYSGSLSGTTVFKIDGNGNGYMSTLHLKSTPALVAVDPALDVDKNARISGNLTVGGTTSVTGNTTLSGTLEVTGNTTIGGSTGTYAEQLKVAGAIHGSNIPVPPNGTDGQPILSQSYYLSTFHNSGVSTDGIWNPAISQIAGGAWNYFLQKVSTFYRPENCPLPFTVLGTQISIHSSLTAPGSEMVDSYEILATLYETSVTTDKRWYDIAITVKNRDSGNMYTRKGTAKTSAIGSFDWSPWQPVGVPTTGVSAKNNFYSSVGWKYGIESEDITATTTDRDGLLGLTLDTESNTNVKSTLAVYCDLTDIPGQSNVRGLAIVNRIDTGATTVANVKRASILFMADQTGASGSTDEKYERILYYCIRQKNASGSYEWGDWLAMPDGSLFMTKSNPYFTGLMFQQTAGGSFTGFQVTTDGRMYSQNVPIKVMDGSTEITDPTLKETYMLSGNEKWIRPTQHFYGGTAPTVAGNNVKVGDIWIDPTSSINSTLEVTNACSYAIGDTKVQYTSKDNPNELYKGSTWDDITDSIPDYDKKFKIWQRIK